MTTYGWLLIIIIHGWGAGFGSTGNAVATAKFSSSERCLAAAKQIESSSILTFCVPR
jgi:hypothetical protein